MIYFIILAVIIRAQLLNIFENKYFKKRGDIYFLIVSLIIIFIAAFRDGIGYDFNSYREIHHKINILGFGANAVGVEFGYYLLNIIGKSDFAIVIFLSALIGVTVKILIINKYSEDKWMSLMVYFTGIFIMFDMGAIRQGIAMAIALVSLKYILDKDLIKFLITILLASLFHLSILLFIPLYFLNSKELNRRSIYLITLISLLISLINFNSLAMSISNYLPNFVATKLQYYLSIDSGNITISLIKRVVFLVIFVEFYKRKNIKDKIALLFLNAYILSVILMGTLSTIDILGGRGAMNLYIMQMFIFSTIMVRLNGKRLKILMLGVIVILSINSMMGPINHGNNSNQQYTPYKSIFTIT